MVKLCRGSGFFVKFFNLAGGKRKLWQDFDCHAPVKRRLIGFVDNPHSATPDFANDFVIAQSWDGFGTTCNTAIVSFYKILFASVFDGDDGREKVKNLILDVGKACRELGITRGLTKPIELDVFFTAFFNRSHLCVDLIIVFKKISQFAIERIVTHTSSLSPIPFDGSADVTFYSNSNENFRPRLILQYILT